MTLNTTGEQEIRAPVPGAAVICLDADRVLLVRRGREPNKGRWSFPGGRVMPGETARAAAERETLEETGIRVETHSVVDVYDAIFPPYHYTVTDFLASPADPEQPGEPSAGDDADHAEWVSLTAISGYHLTDAMVQVLKRASWMAAHGALAPPALGETRRSMVSALRTRRRRRVQGLYVVTDPQLRPGCSHLAIAASALRGGANVVQLRDKLHDAGDLLPGAREMARICREAGALFIVNDRIDLALAAGADGVHLGQSDLPIETAREILGPDRLIGVSVEDVEQVRRAEAAGADYLGVGPIFATASKSDAGAAVGLAQLERFSAVSQLPLIAIGGISAERVPELARSPAAGFAVIGAVLKAPDMQEAARELVGLWEDAR